MSELKTQKNDKDVMLFLENIEDNNVREDCFTLLDIMQEISNEEPIMWGEAIVGFGEYTYKYSSGRTGEWMRIAFSPRKNYISVYVMPGYSEFSGLLDKLGGVKHGKSCLNIKKLSDINLDVLVEIIQKGWEDMKEMYPTK